jgi:multidrug efflux pump subunit AcrA (membrane-fusion protein)
MEAQAAYDLVLQDIAVHSHQVTIAGLQVNLAQVALDSLNKGVDPLLANDIRRAQFAVDKLQAAVADAQIVAPFDGQVQLAFILTEGAAIDAFQYVVTLSDLTELEVRVDTINIQPGQLSEGMPATVSLVGRPGVELKGHIKRLPASGVLAGADQDKSLHIALESSGTLVGYQSGDLTRVALVLEQKQDVLWLPPAAIRTFEGRRFVVVQESGGQRRVDIKVGLEGDDRFEIASGLTEGQIVVGQ